MQNTNTFSSCEWLRSVGNRGYGAAKIPISRDFEITELLNRWRALDVSTRLSAASQLTPDQAATLLAYAERMATLAVRTANREVIVLGLVALGLDGWRDDWRENSAIVSLLFDASERIGAATKQIFEEASDVLPLKAASGLRAFLRRSSEDRSISAMEYETETDADGFRYRRKW